MRGLSDVVIIEERCLFLFPGTSRRESVQGWKSSSPILSTRPTCVGPSAASILTLFQPGEGGKAAGAQTPSCCRGRTQQWHMPLLTNSVVTSLCRGSWEVTLAGRQMLRENPGVLILKDRRMDSQVSWLALPSSPF